MADPTPLFSAEELIGDAVELSLVLDTDPTATGTIDNGTNVSTTVDTDIHVTDLSYMGSFTLSLADVYGGCERCGYYSSEFGHCESEEIFESVKEEFVKHFNEKHRDILMKKGLPLEKKKFTKVKNGSYESVFNSEYNMSFTVSTSSDHAGRFYDECIYDATRPHGERGTRVPEYEVNE